jgi:hypothetical protein
VWRNFNPSVDYKVCNRGSGKCLDVTGSSLADGAELIQQVVPGTDSQKWRITQIAPKQYRFLNLHSGKSLNVVGATKGNGVYLMQLAYQGGQPNELWSFTPTGDGFYKFSPGSDSSASIVGAAPNAVGIPKTAVRQWVYDGTELMQWSIDPAN